MPVNLQNPTTQVSEILPISGINIGVAAAEIKYQNRYDLCLITFDNASIGAVFTQNHFKAAPVQVCQQHLTKGKISGLLINSGCANAATGEEGIKDTLLTCKKLAKLLNCQVEQILPFSTGVILERLPIDKVNSGIDKAIDDLQSASQQSWLNAAKAIMTTDTVAKIYSDRNDIYTATGIAKGSGMIHPNMATMLSFIATDAKVNPELLQELTREIANETFNQITVDGDTSTNDSFVIIATNQVGDLITSKEHPDYSKIHKLLLKITNSLAQSIIRDGEGATKLVTIKILGAKSTKDAKIIADSVALSPLVKTAFFAGDPNLGRILAAIGNAKIWDLEIEKISLAIGSSQANTKNIIVVEKGARAANYHQKSEIEVQKIMQAPEFILEINLNQGEAQTTIYTCDLSYDYVKINSDYRS